ncbi:hypothetical protein [Shinella sumterensis]|uniref:hypothetical protein n=1 Tax=Shinella sumterensis TaxID=1967501 RepID=UPI003F8603B9
MAKSSRGGSGKGRNGAPPELRKSKAASLPEMRKALAGGIVVMICKAEQVLFFLTPSN